MISTYLSVENIIIFLENVIFCNYLYSIILFLVSYTYFKMITYIFNNNLVHIIGFKLLYRYYHYIVLIHGLYDLSKKNVL